MGVFLLRQPATGGAEDDPSGHFRDGKLMGVLTQQEAY